MQFSDIEFINENDALSEELHRFRLEGVKLNREARTEPTTFLRNSNLISGSRVHSANWSHLLF